MFLEINPEVYMYSTSELSVGKILTVHHHGIQKKFPLLPSSLIVISDEKPREILESLQ